jgi:hypothetical protein
MRSCRRRAAPNRHAAFLIYTARGRLAQIPALKQGIVHLRYILAKIQKRGSSTMRALFCAILAACLLSSTASTIAEGKPSLSAEIGAVIEAEGIDAAKKRFADIYPASKDDYEVDIQGMMAVAQGYMQAGNMEAGMAVMEMMSTVSQDMASAAMNTHYPQMAEMQQQAMEAERAAEEQAAREGEKEQGMQQRADAQARGAARDDLDRFKGMYGDPGDRDRLRTLFVTVSCDGYLVTGPMWADVGPWWMRSAADTVFTYADSFTNFSMEFTGEGESTTLRHDLEGAHNPMRRLGPLPDDWSECMERPRR